MFFPKRASLIISFLCILLTSAARTIAATNEVTKWNEVASKAAVDSTLALNFPPIEARLYAMTYAAIHDALNAIDRQYRPYALRLPSSPTASPEAAVATAAHRVLVDQFGRVTDVIGFPSQQAVLDAVYAESLAQIPESANKKAGVLIGEIAAAAILARRAGDGWETQTLLDSKYVEGTKPGEYRLLEHISSPPCRSGAIWRLLSCAMAASSGHDRPLMLVAGVTLLTLMRSSISAVTVLSPRAPALAIRPQLPCSGWKMPLCNGTGLRAVFQRRQV